jgi:hypothetical protein
MGNEFPPEEQWEKLSFWQGFYFARDLADALGYVIPHEEELAFVRALAAGEASLEPSPAESIQRWEKKYQREMPETLRRPGIRVQARRRAAKGRSYESADCPALFRDVGSAANRGRTPLRCARLVN